MNSSEFREDGVDLSVVIVNWNTKDMLRDCLRSLFGHSMRSRVETFVVDNGSADGSADMVASEFPGIHLIRNAHNRGFAAANNQALRLARGRHVLLLNSDTLVHEGVVDASIRYMDTHRDVGAMGCKVLNADGSVQTTCSQFPTLLNLFILTSGLFKVAVLPGTRRYRMEDWARDDERDVEVVSGCYLMARTSAMARIGLLDESFFFFGEETDWCRRFRNAGFAVRFAPVGTIVHFGGGSSKGLNAKRDLMLSEATVRLHRKHGGILAACAAWFILLVFNLTRLAYWAMLWALRRQSHSRLSHFRGVVFGFAKAWPAVKS